MRSYFQSTAVLVLGLGLLSGCGDSTNASEFNAASCRMVEGTLNIHCEPPREFRRLNYMNAASMTGLL